MQIWLNLHFLQAVFVLYAKWNVFWWFAQAMCVLPRLYICIIAHIFRTFHISFPFFKRQFFMQTFRIVFILLLFFCILHMKECYDCFLLERLVEFWIYISHLRNSNVRKRTILFGKNLFLIVWWVLNTSLRLYSATDYLDYWEAKKCFVTRTHSLLHIYSYFLREIVLVLLKKMKMNWEIPTGDNAVVIWF